MRGILLKTLILATFAIILCGGHSLAEASMVHYYDETGKIHYVNTAVSQVPARYLSQVQGQLAEIREQEETEQEDLPIAGNNTSQEWEDSGSEDYDIEALHDPKNIVNFFDSLPMGVELFFAKGCDQCRFAEILLRTKKLTVQRYDVDNSEYGAQVYNEVGGPLPIVKIGDQSVSGYHPQKILKLISDSINKGVNYSAPPHNGAKKPE